MSGVSFRTCISQTIHSLHVCVYLRICVFCLCVFTYLCLSFVCIYVSVSFVCVYLCIWVSCLCVSVYLCLSFVCIYVFVSFFCICIFVYVCMYRSRNAARGGGGHRTPNTLPADKGGKILRNVCVGEHVTVPHLPSLPRPLLCSNYTLVCYMTSKMNGGPVIGTNHITLQHAATHSNKLHHTATHCNSCLQHRRWTSDRW